MKLLEKIKSFLIDNRVERLNSQLEFQLRENEQLKIRNQILEEQYKNLFLSVKNFFDSKEKKDSKTWRLIEAEGEELWYRPEHLTLVGKVKELDGNYSFNVIVDTNLLTLSYSNKEECDQVRMTLLNVDRIPSSDEISDEKKKERIVRAFSKEKPKTKKEEKEEKKYNINIEQLEKTIKNKKK